jgi:GT2 family glycosyltransferase
MKLPKVFIVILNYNGKDCLLKTLASVFNIDYPNFEVVLVDNASEDGSFEKARLTYSKYIFIKNTQNLGFSAGNNLGIKYALERGADYVLLLNYDTEVEKSFLRYLVSLAETDDKIGLVSPLIYNQNNAVWFSGGKINWLRMRTYHKKEELEKDYFGSDFITGCAMLINAKIFKKIGLLDENYFLYYEDADFSLRAKKAGFRLAVSGRSRIKHLEKSESDQLKKVYWLVVSGLIFFRKNSPISLLPWFFVYKQGRMLKNILDRRNKQNKIAEAVKRAYKDFQYVSDK